MKLSKEKLQQVIRKELLEAFSSRLASDVEGRAGLYTTSAPKKRKFRLDRWAQKDSYEDRMDKRMKTKTELRDQEIEVERSADEMMQIFKDLPVYWQQDLMRLILNKMEEEHAYKRGL